MSAMTLDASPRLLFEVGEHAYLLPLDAVSEVTPADRPRLIPRVPMDLAGILNVRGEPVVVIDGGRALDGLRAPPYPHAILLEGDEGRVGILVSAVSRIERRRPTLIEEFEDDPTAATLVTPARLREREVGLVDVPLLHERVQELLGAVAPGSGGGTCPSGF
jgi:chemotaxis signal transduction protein